MCRGWRPAVQRRNGHAEILGHVKVDVEIAVGHAITHVAHAAPRHLSVRLDELGIAIHHLRGNLADDDEVHDDGLLGAPVGQEIVFGQSLHEAARIGCVPAVCDRGNCAVGSRSYRLRFREHLGPELRRQVARRQQIDVNAKQRFQFVL